MFDPTTDFDRIMREGLRAVPVPDVSAAFDAVVLEAVSTPIPWWRLLVSQARPLFSGAVCSLVATLFLLHWCISMPVNRSSGHAEGSGEVIALDQVLDQSVVKAGSLSRFSRFAAVSAHVEPAPPPKAGRDAAPGRRSQTDLPPVV